MKKLFLLILVISSLLLTSCSKKVTPDPIDDNYRVFYEIFTGSFSDSNGDGIGDLNGIINRLDYLNDGNIDSGKSLGIQGIWLTPIFASPSYHKYDVKDYYSIDPKFGSQEDLDKLIKECHDRNIILILDMVINHTSKEHEWFKQFVKAHQSNDTSNKYYDYYVFADNDSLPGGRRFRIISGTNQSYECNFSDDMPELNFDNENVRNDVLEIARYYLDKGIDGFRFDAAKYVYFGDNGSSIDFWNWYCKELKKIKEDVYLVAEVWSGEAEVNEYIKAMNCFNFSMSQAEGVIASASKGNNINTYTSYIESYQDRLRAINREAMMISFISNHDMDRAAGYLSVSTGLAYIGANLNILTPGSPFIYYGEEIGMKGSRGGANTDANRRLAMLWGDNDTVKDPEGSTYELKNQINGTVKENLDKKDSLLRHYSKLIRIRKLYPEIARGTYTKLDLGDSSLGGFRIDYDGQTVYLIHNATDAQQTIKLNDVSKLLESAGFDQAEFKSGELKIGPYTSALLK